MSKNKFTTYLLYAIGEIVLVVIGILIAVNINNWNSERKLSNSAEIHLEVLKLDLNKDLAELEKLHKATSDNFEKARKLMLQFQTLLPVDANTTEYLASLVLELNFTAHTIGFSALENSGELSTLSDELQQAIRSYYAAVKYIQSRESISNIFIRNRYETLLFARQDIWNSENRFEDTKLVYEHDPREVAPFDKIAFLNDKVLENHVLGRRYQTKFQKLAYEEGITSLKKVLALIDGR